MSGLEGLARSAGRVELPGRAEAHRPAPGISFENLAASYFTIDGLRLGGVP
jgi:hypothetical protein